MAENKLIQISNKDWHYRLIEYCWGIDPMMFKNLCPYFWLSIASVFACIPISLWKCGKWLFVSLGNGFIKFIDYVTNECSTILNDYSYENKINNLTNGQIYYLCNYKDRSRTWEADTLDFFSNLNRKTGKSIDDFISDVLKAKNLKKGFVTQAYKDDYMRDVAKIKKLEAEKEKRRELKWKEYLEKEKKNEEKRRIEVQKKAEHDKKMLEFTRKVSTFTKNLFSVLFIALVGFICYFLSSLLTITLIEICKFCSGVDWIEVLTFIGIVTLLSAVFVGGSIGVYYTVDKLLKVLSKKEDYDGYKLLIVNCIYYPLEGVVRGVYYFELYFLWYPIVIFLGKVVIMGIINGFVEGFNEFGGIFKDYFNASYSDYCPGIDWKKENK